MCGCSVDILALHDTLAATVSLATLKRRCRLRRIKFGLGAPFGANPIAAKTCGGGASECRVPTIGRVR